MKKIKTLLIFSLVIALSFSLLGCKLLPWGDSVAEETAVIADLPHWLTLAHRAEAAEEPEVDEEQETEEEETAAAPSQAATTTQPAQQTQQSAQNSGIPKWQQQGTMEYITKLQLDQKVLDVEKETKMTPPDKEKIAQMLLEIYEMAKGIGLDLEKEYGIKVSSGGGDGWFNDWTGPSPSGFGN